MSKPRRIGVLTTGRQDYGILRSTLLLLRDDHTFDLRLFVGGMHSSPAYGLTVRQVEDDGFAPAESLDWLGPHESAVTTQAASALVQVADALQRHGPQALVLVGDRYETAAAALAATLCRVPIVHLHGGEETEGAFDNALRHAITKMSHLHLVSQPTYAERVRQMGEDPASIHVVGAPGLDNLCRNDLPCRDELAQLLGLPLEPPVVVVTVHPATLGEDESAEVEAVGAVLQDLPGTCVITLPNSDPGHERIRSRLLQLAAERPQSVAREALGDRSYMGLLRVANLMLGNSSSALVEAPALGLPVVNVGDRQKGRIGGRNVISVPATPEAVRQAVSRALSPEFCSQAAAEVSLWADGKAGERIVAILRRWQPPVPPRKRFFAVAGFSDAA